jgi:DNA-3-methyladenine glycosylase I
MLKKSEIRDLIRCPFCGDDPLYTAYHDEEWGVPLFDEHKLFEFLILEGMQAGLSWITILRKRENMRKAFAEFDPEKLVKFTPKKIEQLMQDSTIIRNRLKIEAAIINAKSYLALKEKGQGLSDFLWQFTDGKVITNHWKARNLVPVTSPAAKMMAKELKANGFKFVGETICYALMQAVGIVNDHLVECYRHQQLVKNKHPMRKAK